MSKLSDRIRAGQFVVTGELTPPKGVDLGELLARAESLRDSVHAFNITESPRARMAVEPKSVGRLLLERGIEPIVQITARDRNRIAIQADMLGAALLGIENLLVMRGDPPNHGDHPEAKGVYDLETVDMLRAARCLARGRDLSGAELQGTPQLFVGATVNPGARDLAAEIANVKGKIDAGAQFLQTQALYDATALERFLAAAKIDGTPLLAGVIPLKSVKMAAWLNANVPGIRVPEVLLKEMDAAGAQQRETEAGIEIAARLVSSLKPLVAGVHIMALGWEEHIPQILRRSGVG
jgi:methylenetetrahydrofolate reductase (NADPH)